jgi:hypothetical protein
MKTTTEILDEIAAKYTLSKRSINDVDKNGYKCFYNGPNDKHCAFGMMCIDPSKLIEGQNSTYQLVTLGMEILKEEYRGHSVEFYKSCQHLHDDYRYWDENGLNKKGLKELQQLKKQYMEPTKVLTPTEILNQIASMYNLNTRSVDNASRCLYNGPGNKHCAFANMCIDPSILEENRSASTLLDKLGINILKEEYRGYSFYFYDNVQGFHDIKSNWSDEGLSDFGTKTLARLKAKWGQMQPTDDIRKMQDYNYGWFGS